MERQVVVLVMVALSTSLGLAACGGGDSVTAQGGPAGGRLTISTLPDYIDTGVSEAVAGFEAETNVSVDYRAEPSDNERFLAELQPLFERGESGGRSILIVSDWMAKQMYDHGYLQEIDRDDLPAVFANMQPYLRGPAFDPERKFSIPWQSSMTGIWVDVPAAPALDSVVEFFDPGIAGEAMMLAELRDSVPLVLLAERKNPLRASTADWLESINRIESAEDVGQLRSLTGEEYVDYLNRKLIVAAFGRSSDAPLVKNPTAKWMVPAQGCVLSSWNMVIPVGAPNTAAALAWMDYVYRPAVAAAIAEQVPYISPVKGVKELLEKRKSGLARNSLLFPSEKVISRCTDQASSPDRERVGQAWQAALED